ncbi:DUF5682 family protein [Paenibacillus chondroitinus]|uniref:DUF5682 family protein n=1 Tax=Paenibacillus chondroitinus TaxID=59842 RepID=A0ABU6D6Y1_9BACL|nr:MULTISPECIES: DUF5682 family protein [Paenibacillus]MCY9661170.1 DUF5682 family protein [Paenibacillus anseongense]MEB4793480.1 DUF5682 family protein [Paenibacillus chondroitinus]
MEKSVLRMLGDEQLAQDSGFHVFGIRHLSPAGAHHLLAFLDEIRPTAVLVEGPSDASPYIEELSSSGVVPPIAILAYTNELPVRTLLYPYASYSPEYQAFQWASRNSALAAFIDLPSEHALALYEQRQRTSFISEAAKAEEYQTYVHQQRTLYQQLAELSEEPDYEAYWERHFEHNLQKNAYRMSIHQYSLQMRELTAPQEMKFAPQETAYNEIREAYMRRKIQETIASGHAPEKIVVVTGAHHASALDFRFPSMTDQELNGLPKTATKLTLMPYSYYKLSSHSGYGAGNQAPAYFELLWQCLQKGDLKRLPALYFSQVAVHLREQGTHRSTASLIEAVRLSEALAAMHEGSQPTWRDMRDAAMVCLGYGELSTISEALARTDIGTAIGRLPEGVSQTPIQDDLNRELSRLKLSKFKSAVATTLELDLRENRRVKSEEAAFLDLKRSIFLQRLELLGISFAKKQRVNQASASWAEVWVLQWTPEAEIQAVESTLKGETIELAAAYALKERLDSCADIAEASRIIRIACDCDLTVLMEQATSALQGLAVDAGSFEQVAAAAYELSVLIRYGSIRRIETNSLLPLLRQLFLRGTLLLMDASSCNDDAAHGMVRAMQSLNTIAQDEFEVVDDLLWFSKLQELASRDDRNAKLSGFAFAILLERNDITDERVAQEVSRRLSPGIPVDLGAGWFEGMSMRNRYALLSRVTLWQQLDTYIGSLEKEAFHRSLVFLRRAFGSFEPREKAVVAEMMGDIWGVDTDRTGAALQQPLSEEEKGKLDELNDFDFGDL